MRAIQSVYSISLFERFRGMPVDMSGNTNHCRSAGLFGDQDGTQIIRGSPTYQASPALANGLRSKQSSLSGIWKSPPG
jgi:hypothetical protein